MLFALAAFCNKKSLRLNVTQGFLLERLMGVEPTSSAWKADVLAVVRQPRNNSTYYTHLRGVCQAHRAVFSCLCYPFAILFYILHP